MKINTIPFNVAKDPGARLTGMVAMSLGLLVLALYVIMSGQAATTWWVLGLFVVILMIGVGDELLMPTKYILGTKSIVVERRLWKTKIPMSMVTRVELMESDKIGGRMPLFPLGWRSVNGSYGKFVAGKEVWTFHAHRKERFIVIHTLKGTIAISPEPAARFISQAQDILNLPNRQLGRSS